MSVLALLVTCCTTILQSMAQSEGKMQSFTQSAGCCCAKGLFCYNYYRKNKHPTTKQKENQLRDKSLNGESLQYLFKLETQHIAIILINIYMVHNEDTEDGMAWFGMMTR